MSVTHPRSEYEELVYIAERLARRFPTVEEDAIIRLLADELADYDHARLRAYVPVLVEGKVTRRLRAERSAQVGAGERRDLQRLGVEG